MRSQRGISPPAIALPPYFAPSRYDTLGEDPQIDHENKKIWSLPTIIERGSNQVKFINHVHTRSADDELLNNAENALLGDTKTSDDSSGIHPGILYGGPAGGILAPIGVYLYKIFRRRCRKKKQQKRNKKEDSEEENEESDGETTKDAITTAVGNQISNATSSVMNHIKGKISATGTSLVDNLKAQAVAQEEEMLENIKTTILEQEEAMVMNIKEKFATTQTSLIQDIKSRFSLFKKTEPSSTTFEEKRKDEESLLKLSDSEEELRITVKRRISNSQNALIPEIEKSIESTSENIIKNIEDRIPEAKGHTWDRIKSSMKEKCGTMCTDIKSMLTCTENKIIDDVQSHIGEVKTDGNKERTMQSTCHLVDETTVKIIQHELNKRNLTPSEATEMKIDAKEENKNISELKIEDETTTNKVLDADKTGVKGIIKMIEQNSNHNGSDGSNRTTEILEETVIQKKKAVGLTKELNKFDKIKQKLSEIPSHLLKHNTKISHDTTQNETKKSEEINLIQDGENLQIHADAMQKTSPIPIPCKHLTKLNHFPTNVESVKVENLEENTSKSSSSTMEEDEPNNTSFLDKFKNSVSHLPFILNFSGLPRDNGDFKKEDIASELSEVKVIDENVTTALNKKVDIATEKSECIPSRRWIVLEDNNGDWPGHLPRKSNPEQEKSEESVNPPTVKWLQLVEEKISTYWPSHLPKNIHGVNGAKIVQNCPKDPKSLRSRRNDCPNEDSDSQEEDDLVWRERLSKNLLLKPINNDDDRKESLVSTISEFSTTSSIESASTSTQEGTDNFPVSKLPNIDRKFKTKKERNSRLKSLDSGIHHYFGEYIEIEFPVSSGTEKNTSEAEGTSKEEGSSENSQEDVRSVVEESVLSHIDRESLIQKMDEVDGDGGGCYEGFVVSLGNKKCQKFSMDNEGDSMA